MPEVQSAARRIPKATYVPLQVDAPSTPTGGAIAKFGFVRNLTLQPGEVDLVRQSALPFGTGNLAKPAKNSALWRALRSFEGTPMPSQLPSPNALANVPAAILQAFGKAVVALRQQALNQAKQVPPAALNAAPTFIRNSTNLGRTMVGLNTAITATNNFEANVSATPIGMLNLERLEMTPAGIERGELLATIPLAPKEQTAVVQKEWSVTTQEFTSIVTDSLDNYSETGVTENTDLSQSTTSQTQHANQFNITGSVSGSYGFVTASATTSFAAQNSNSQSATDSRNHAISATRKASSRVKQEHKMTISTTTVTGTSETTTRILQNPSDSNPMRIDYFGLMRKWHVELYRYGLRLTYDIGIPEPGGALRKIYAQLDDLQNQVAQSFVFSVNYSDITQQSYPNLASIYGAQVPPYPGPAPILSLGGQVPGMTNDDKDQSFHFNTLSLTVPDGWMISGIVMTAILSHINAFRSLVVFGAAEIDVQPNEQQPKTVNLGGFLSGATGQQQITYFVANCGNAAITFEVTCSPTDAAIEQWTAAVWAALHNAAQTTFYAQQQSINAQISALQNQISAVDTLTLRREESEEIMKGVLRWLLGTGFEFMPPDVMGVFTNSGGDLTHGVSFTGNDLGLQPTDWTTMFQYQEMVKFINEAIEWENVLYFLYSYFWDVPPSWDFVRQIRHPDATRQAFLRAGSARVVLTVRKGFEQAWMSFVELGDFGQMLPPDHPYMTIAQEIADYDNTNYPGIPAANPGGGLPPDTSQQVATTSSDTIMASGKPVTISVGSSSGFIIGYRIIIDTYESSVQETQTIVGIPDSTHVTLASITNPHDGSKAPIALMQAGEQGQLIAEWFEYTPSSGTDIAVTSNLATIA